MIELKGFLRLVDAFSSVHPETAAHEIAASKTSLFAGILRSGGVLPGGRRTSPSHGFPVKQRLLRVKLLFCANREPVLLSARK
jgi:hypothetical protein